MRTALETVTSVFRFEWDRKLVVGEEVDDYAGMQDEIRGVG